MKIELQEKWKENFQLPNFRKMSAKTGSTKSIPLFTEIKPSSNIRVVSDHCIQEEDNDWELRKEG